MHRNVVLPSEIRSFNVRAFYMCLHNINCSVNGLYYSTTSIMSKAYWVNKYLVKDNKTDVGSKTDFVFTIL